MPGISSVDSAGEPSEQRLAFRKILVGQILSRRVEHRAQLRFSLESKPEGAVDSNADLAISGGCRHGDSRVGTQQGTSLNASVQPAQIGPARACSRAAARPRGTLAISVLPTPASLSRRSGRRSSIERKSAVAVIASATEPSASIAFQRAAISGFMGGGA